MRVEPAIIYMSHIHGPVSKEMIEKLPKITTYFLHIYPKLKFYYIELLSFDNVPFTVKLLSFGVPPYKDKVYDDIPNIILVPNKFINYRNIPGAVDLKSYAAGKWYTVDHIEWLKTALTNNNFLEHCI